MLVSAVCASSMLGVARRRPWKQEVQQVPRFLQELQCQQMGPWALPLHRAVLVTEAEMQTQPKCPSADGRTEKMGSIHTMEHYSLFKSESEVTHLRLTLCHPMGCSPPGSFIQGILQARVLEWVVISFSRGSSQPRDRTRVSRIVGRHFTIWATREVIFKEERILQYAKAWMDLGDIILCEISQSQNMYCMIPLGHLNSKIQRMEK